MRLPRFGFSTWIVTVFAAACFLPVWIRIVTDWQDPLYRPGAIVGALLTLFAILGIAGVVELYDREKNSK